MGQDLAFSQGQGVQQCRDVICRQQKWEKNPAGTWGCSTAQNPAPDGSGVWGGHRSLAAT